MSSPALADPATRAALPRWRRSFTAAALMGLVCAICGLVTHLVVVAANDDLRAHGVRAAGTVQEVRAHARSGTEDVVVAFAVAERPVRATVVVGLFAPAYDRGDRVTVFHAPGDPQRLTIDDVDALAGGRVQVLSLIGWVGSVLLLVGVVRLVGDRRDRARLRGVLASGPWKAGPVRVGWTEEDPAFGDLDDADTVLTTPDGVPWLVEQSWPDDRRPWSAPPRQWVTGVGWADLPDVHERGAWWVVDGDTAVFSPDRGAPLVLARRSARPGTERDGRHVPEDAACPQAPAREDER